jgi:hypothetical protein
LLCGLSRTAQRSEPGEFAQPTSIGAEVNPRLSRVSLAKSCAAIRLIESAFTLVDCRPERPLLLSWEQRTAICTRQSVTFWSRLWGRHRPSLCVCRDATRWRARRQANPG